MRVRPGSVTVRVFAVGATGSRVQAGLEGNQGTPSRGMASLRALGNDSLLKWLASSNGNLA